MSASLFTVLLGAFPLVSAYAAGLEVAYSLEKATQGISISSTGRIFLSQRYSTTAPPLAVELLADNTTVPYPDAAWNSYNSSDPSSDPAKTFVSIDGARIGPDGRYWLVDGGSNGVNGSTKLVGVNLTTDTVDKIYPLETAADDVRFGPSGDVAYLSDTNGALMVLNMTTGTVVRVLESDPSAMAYFPMSYNGTLVPGYQGTGSTLSVGLDQMEVSPDGTWLYYQPCNGGMYRVETRYVDASLTNATLAANLGDYVQPFAVTPSTGGTTIDGDGNIYVSDTNLLAIWKVTPEGRATVLVQDDALVWTDLMWVTADKKLWLPASQMRPGADGLMAEGPNMIFTYPIEAERLWNQAFEDLKANNPEVVGAYEKLLSARLLDIESFPNTQTENRIQACEQERWKQMKELVLAGLRKTEKDAAIRQKIGEGIRIMGPTKAVIEKSLQTNPQAAIAWVPVSFALEILANPFTEPGIHRDGLSYVVSRMEWYWNLVDLLLDNNSLDPGIGLRSEVEKRITDLYQKLFLYQMKSICRFYRSRSVIFFRDTFKVDDWDTQVKDIKTAELVVIRDSETFSTQTIRRHIGSLARRADELYEELKSVNSSIQDQTRRLEEMKEDEENKKCMSALSNTYPPDDRSRIVDDKGGLLRDSYRWVLDHPEYDLWRTDSNSRRLWIRGDPGKGKTMLICGVIEELEKDNSERLGYFFCQATLETLNNSTAVLGGLIHHLVRRYPWLLRHVRKEYDLGGAQRFNGQNSWQVRSEILLTMLQDPFLDGTILIVDALDECVKDRVRLLDFINKTSLQARIKWLVSSRNEDDIKEKFSIPTHKFGHSIELTKELTSGAVGVYIKHKIADLVAEKRFMSDKKTRDNVERHLTVKSDDTFLWVALSAKDFLHDADEIFPDGVAAQHRVVFLRSLGLLSRKLKRDHYNLEDPAVFIDDIRAPIEDPLAPLRYSTMYWVTHLNEYMASTTVQDFDMVHEFLCTKFLHWIEALILLKSLRRAIMAIGKLETTMRAYLLPN
ncbi:Vegetative incompatibility protein HET-E-1 [Colletotrichum sidae]|uniref:Vegetative incompatibility protein HET-E-1 n=1 Tax=Colletotrichum sidae TaxID=1347389 RepID=A0A4R8T647_9PEZI|nr:Vegetative incompatibility protein HET-E-1 [Colletotrichum sidae]